MRLIDADVFKQQIGAATIQNGFAKSATKASVMLELVDMQPTAYDVDKVAEQLKKEFKKYYGNNWDEEPYLVKGIEIVKGGGANECMCGICNCCVGNCPVEGEWERCEKNQELLSEFERCEKPE